jgi:hypothetical protein
MARIVRSDSWNSQHREDRHQHRVPTRVAVEQKTAKSQDADQYEKLAEGRQVPGPGCRSINQQRHRGETGHHDPRLAAKLWGHPEVEDGHRGDGIQTLKNVIGSFAGEKDLLALPPVAQAQGCAKRDQRIPPGNRFRVELADGRELGNQQVELGRKGEFRHPERVD